MAKNIQPNRFLLFVKNIICWFVVTIIIFKVKKLRFILWVLKVHSALSG